MLKNTRDTPGRVATLPLTAMICGIWYFITSSIYAKSFGAVWCDGVVPRRAMVAVRLIAL
jgi:hypothetical protein